MIHLADPGLDQAASEQLARYQREVDEATNYADRVARAKDLFPRRNRPSNATFRSVRETLTVMCSGAQRCVYCEDSVGDEVEHIQPKDLYPCLVFVWTNYVYACGTCNRAKSNRFSVVSNGGIADVTRRRSAPIVRPRAGAPAFINPRVDNPMDYLHLDLATFVVVPRGGVDDLHQQKAGFTIETLKLNRDVLLAARQTAYNSYRSGLFEYVRQSPDAPTDELAALIQHVRTMPHPTVWAEMKRQRTSVADLDDLFRQAPEAMQW